MKYFNSRTLFFIIFVLFQFQSFGQNIVGPWKGNLSTPTGDLTIIFNIKHNGRDFLGTMDVPQQGAKGIPIHKVAIQQPFITIELPNLGIRYTGNILDDDHIEGTFQQAGQNLPLQLVKSLDIDIPKPKPQEPQPPFPYITKEVEFKNEKENIVLSGTFTRPTTAQKYPAVILISGSGPQDRNQEILGHKSFLFLSDYLTRKGIAVLRFDDRGTAKSTGNFETATTHNFANDVEAAYHFLKSRNDVDVQNIGLLGHSEGGVVAAITYESTPDIGFIILMASPGVRGKELMLEQKKVMETKLQVPTAVIEKNQKVFGEAYDMIIRNEQPLYDRISELFKHQFNAELSNKMVHNIAQTLSNDWFTNFIRLDPADYYKKIKCPTLALNGSKDVQVVAETNLEGIEKAFKEAGNSELTIKKLEGLNHLFQECDTGLPKEYGNIDQTLSPIVLEEISDWIIKQTNKI